MISSIPTDRRFAFVGLKIEFDPHDRVSMEAWFNLAHRVEFLSLDAGSELQSQHTSSQFIYFLANGIAREFFVRPNGQETNRAFHRPFTVVGSLDSYKRTVNNHSNIQLLNSGHVYRLSCQKLIQLMEQFPELHTWYRLNVFRTSAQVQNRLADLLAKKPDQRLTEFVDQSPDLLREVSAHHLANFLDVPSVVVSIVKKRALAQTKQIEEAYC